MTSTRKAIRLIVTLIVAATAASLSAQPAVAAPPPGSPHWQACPPDVAALDPRVECATVRVPLDYHRPSGDTIEVAISRVRTAKPALRQGVLLFNPGGPGGPGLNLSAVFTHFLPQDVQDRYDLIGFDPRGIGRSAPVSCGLTEAQRTDVTKILPYPKPNGDISQNVRFAFDVAASCARTDRALLPFITTANTARDLDAIRAALGEPKISYLGYSYGSYLGAVYATLFPNRGDRIILDSVVDPTRIWREVFRAWGPAIEVRLGDFDRWAAARDDTYHLGATPGAVRQLFFDLVARLDAHPLPVGTTVVDGNRFRELNRGAMYSDASFPTLAQNYRFVLDNVSSALAFPEVPADNSPASLYAVLCDDTRWPRSIERYARDVHTDLNAFPAVGGMAANMFPCAAWPFPPREPAVHLSDRGPANVLLVQGLRDPATPYPGAQAMRATLGNRSRLVTVDIGGHAVSYGVNANLNTCADDLTTAFLLTGHLPTTDRFCGPELSSTTTQLAGDPTINRAVDKLRQQLRNGI
jgi:pimeloyl-ACP methyl ester carboxylesterase